MSHWKPSMVGESNGSWTEDEDRILCDGVADGLTFEKISWQLPKRTRNACIGRFRRITEEMGAVE